MSDTRYTPTENGFAINGSSEVFNRTLYGAHTNDDKASRFFTFAGDAPQFMGALTDWEKNLVSFYAKCGTLTSGLALTPDQRVGFFYSEDMDISSRWFHNSEDIRAEFKNGHMEYELSQMSPWFPDVDVRIEAYPLLPDDGFLVRYRITTAQRVLFTAGFGGLTDYIGRFEYRDEAKRYFHASDCAGNTVTVNGDRATVSAADGRKMTIASTFATASLGSAAALVTPYPSTFLGSTPADADDAVVKLSAGIEAGQELDGIIVVLHDADDTAVDGWLAHPDPTAAIDARIYEKHSCIAVHTPDHLLDLTVAPTVIALDASYHNNSFHHGAFGYHSPFLGWRNWYAPTVLGWNDRVEAVMAAHLGQMIETADGEERVWFDGGGAREGDSNDPSPYHNIENSTGYLPYLLGETMAYYNMQECALDMMLHHIEWSGDLDLANTYFDKFCAMLDWEERILDPDGDGLYQNFLNTWISDGHSYNGAGCAQASAYNYRANAAMAKIAKKLGRPADVFEARARKIRAAVQEKLSLPHEGGVAESLDTVGNRLIHPVPELSTAYLAVDCRLVDDLQAYTLLKYTEDHIKSIETPYRKGRLSYCSSWLPKKYSTYGIFPAENAHLALAYFKCGLSEQGNALMRGLADCYFTGRNPGMAAHVQSSRGTADLADLDFTDVSSMYLRAMTEGLFGIGINALDDVVTVAPNFPADWDHASLTLRDLSLHYDRHGREEILDLSCDRTGKKQFRLPMRAASVVSVLLDGSPAPYTVTPAPQHSVIVVETEAVGHCQLRIVHGDEPLPTVTFSPLTLAGETLVLRVENGDLAEVVDVSEALTNVRTVGNTVYATTRPVSGKHTVFLRVKSGAYDAYLPAHYEIVTENAARPAPAEGRTFVPLDHADAFNCSVGAIHDREFLSPRPEGYSIGVFPNGRYAWEWTHRGHNQLYVDDSALRISGCVVSPSGIPFQTPQTGDNVACVSVWDNFPTELTVPLSGTAKELAVLFVSTTNAMQTGVENARITVEYADGTSEPVPLVYPVNIDDWLIPALQTEGESVYWNDYDHATVCRIPLDSKKDLARVRFDAVANEVILGILGISISR